jgi:hypothetical protein
MFPGDNENDPDSALTFYDLLQEVDLIVPFIHNTEIKPAPRSSDRAHRNGIDSAARRLNQHTGRVGIAQAVTVVRQNLQPQSRIEPGGGSRLRFPGDTWFGYKPLNPQNLMKTSGRGIFYMKTFMDEVSLHYAMINGNLEMEGSSFIKLVTAENLKISRNLFLGKARFSEKVSFPSLRVLGYLDMSGGTFTQVDLSRAVKVGPNASGA